MNLDFLYGLLISLSLITFNKEKAPIKAIWFTNQVPSTKNYLLSVQINGNDTIYTFNAIYKNKLIIK